MLIVWDIDPVLRPGPAPMRYYGLFLAIALIGAFLLFRWRMMRAGHDEHKAALFLGYGMAGVVIGARLVHCIFYDFARCFAMPYNVLMVWRGGLASHGALFGLLVAIAIYCRRHRVAVVEVMDRLSLGAAWGSAWVRIGNLFNSEVVGRPTGASWGFKFPHFDKLPLEQVPPRHPTQLYEFSMAMVIFFLLLGLMRRYEKRPAKPGLYAALFLTLYFSARFVVEFFKEYQALASSSTLTMGQWLSIAPALLGGLWLVRIFRRSPT
jgi:phosphatidylglycerol:prolipoprotein diacylglycerol transferase